MYQIKYKQKICMGVYNGEAKANLFKHPYRSDAKSSF